MKRLLTVMLAALCLLPLGMGAADALDTSKLTAPSNLTVPSSLTVAAKYGEEKLSGISVAVCRAADLVEANGTLVFAAILAFSGAGADFTNLTQEKNTALAAALDAFAAANNIRRSIKSTDSGGNAAFTDLPGAVPGGAGGRREQRLCHRALSRSGARPERSDEPVGIRCDRLSKSGAYPERFYIRECA